MAVVDEEAEKVAANTFDLGEYLALLARDGTLDTGFVRPQGKIAYHLPCHLKSQNIGFRSFQLLKRIPDTTVTMSRPTPRNTMNTYGSRAETM